MQSILLDRKKRNLGQRIYTDNNRRFETLYSANEQDFITTDFEVVNNLEFTPYFDTQTLIIIFASFQIYITGSGPGATEIAIDVDGVNVKTLNSLHGEPKTSTLYHSILLDDGSHSVKLKARLTDDFGFQEVHVKETRLSYIELVKN